MNVFFINNAVLLIGSLDWKMENVYMDRCCTCWNTLKLNLKVSTSSLLFHSKCNVLLYRANTAKMCHCPSIYTLQRICSCKERKVLFFKMARRPVSCRFKCGCPRNSSIRQMQCAVRWAAQQLADRKWIYGSMSFEWARSKSEGHLSMHQWLWNASRLHLQQLIK